MDQAALVTAYMQVTGDKCNLIQKGIDRLERVIGTPPRDCAALIEEKQVYRLLLIGYHRLGMTKQFNDLKNKYTFTKANRIPDKTTRGATVKGGDDVKTKKTSGTLSSSSLIPDLTVASPQGADLIVDLQKLRDLSIDTALWSFICLSTAYGI